MSTTVDKLSVNTEKLQKHIRAQFDKTDVIVGEQLATQVLQAFKQGKIPATELYSLVNAIRQRGHTNNSTCDQLMLEYKNAYKYEYRNVSIFPSEAYPSREQSY